MDLPEYKSRMEALHTRHASEIRELNAEYALANNPVKVGQVIRSAVCMIRVERIRVYARHYGPPCCAYTGPQLTKSGRPYKSGAVETIYQDNIREIKDA